MDALKCLKTRRSVRTFTDQTVSKEIIEDILECGRWTPSGINHQPWKVFVISNPELKAKIADCTHYSNIILQAPHLFVIYLDQTKGYNYVKNVQSMGAFFENILLAIHAHDLGGVWLGEIYNQKDQVDEAMGVSDSKWEFMGAIAFGHPEKAGKSTRDPLDHIIIDWR